MRLIKFLHVTFLLGYIEIIPAYSFVLLLLVSSNLGYTFVINLSLRIIFINFIKEWKGISSSHDLRVKLRYELFVLTSMSRKEIRPFRTFPVLNEIMFFQKRNKSKSTTSKLTKLVWRSSFYLWKQNIIKLKKKWNIAKSQLRRRFFQWKDIITIKNSFGVGMLRIPRVFSCLSC